MNRYTRLHCPFCEAVCCGFTDLGCHVYLRHMPGVGFQCVCGFAGRSKGVDIGRRIVAVGGHLRRLKNLDEHLRQHHALTQIANVGEE